MLLDVLSADQRFGPQSRQALKRCAGEGRLEACEAVWAEVAAAFGSNDLAEAALTRAGIHFSPMSREAGSTAGLAWRAYRRAGGSRRRIMTDFLIAAHAMVQSERLLTRNRGFYRRYFEQLHIVDPTEG